MAISIKFSGHSKVVFANARSSLKFCVSHIARFIVHIWSVSRLFPRVFLSIASLENINKVGSNFFSSYYLLIKVVLAGHEFLVLVYR